MLGTAVPGDARLVAASPPHPAVAIAHFSSLVHALHTADLNNDGRPDLIGTTAGGDLQAALGRGDGTFNPPRSLAIAARALAVADFNRDGRLDVVITGLALLPGRGDGTFSSPRVIDSSVGSPTEDHVHPTAVTGDFDGNGTMDLALPVNAGIRIYPGRGDLTFAPPVEVPVADGSIAIVANDFDRNGRLDLASVTVAGYVEILLNQGAFLFSSAPVPTAFDMHDIDSGDFNQDGSPDLVVTRAGFAPWGYQQGEFDVILNNGDGTFATGTTYATGVHGTVSLAVGDFNGDGHLDIATGNRSAIFLDNPCTGAVYWDSVTIAPGVGDGAFGGPATFRLAARNFGDHLYQHAHSLLMSGDLNADGRTDLVTSPGAIVLSRAAAANRNPAVSAGPDQTIVPSSDGVRFEASASDPDHDWLDFVWRTASGEVFGPRFDGMDGMPMFCWSEPAGTYSVTVTDRRGGSATDTMNVYPSFPEGSFLGVSRPGFNESLGTETPFTITWEVSGFPSLASFRLLSSSDDGKSWTAVPGCTGLPASARQCVWSSPGPPTQNGRIQVEAYDSGGSRIAFDASERFSIHTGPSTALPPGWFHTDVGSVGPQGNATYTAGTFTVTGAGADIWNNADQFHYAFRHISGDFEAIARVASVEHVHRWTKAGLMIRDQVFPGSRHASVFATPSTEKGIAFQRRPEMNGPSVHTAGPALAPPVWLRLVRAGNEVSAYYRSSATASWTLIGTQTFAVLSHGLQVGLAVSSHVHTTLAAATFDNVQVSEASVPSGWSHYDVGEVTAPGDAEVTASTANVTGNGADIWGTADAFHWAFRRASGNFSIEAEVQNVQPVHRWTKAGLMIRASSAPGSQHASVFATPTTEKGVAFQARRVNDGASVHLNSQALAPAVWLRLTRTGSVVNAYFRKLKTDPWRHMGSVELTGLPATVEVGLAVTSHTAGSLAAAEFRNMAIERLPDWSTLRIGAGDGSAFVNGTFFAVENRGLDIWGTSDAFTYVYTRWTGDGALTARLNHLDFAHEWTKGGVMFRESLAANSKHAFLLASPAKGTALQYRASTGGASASAGAMPGKHAPWEFGPGFWLLLVREGDVFTAYVSDETFVWRPVGQVAIPMSREIYVGLAVTSHNTGQSARGLFDDVTLRVGPFHPVPPPAASTP